MRNELGLRNGTKIVGTVANLRQTKGYQYFVQAAGKVLADGARHTLRRHRGYLSGTSRSRSLRNDQTRWELRTASAFLGFRKDVPELLNELDVFVLASVSEGFPLVALQAMAASRPMVVTRSGGPQEIIDDDRNGFLVAASRLGRFGGENHRAAARSWLVAGICACGSRAKVGTTFSIEKMISEYEALYDRLLSWRDGAMIWVFWLRYCLFSMRSRVIRSGCGSFLAFVTVRIIAASSLPATFDYHCGA